MYRYAQVDKEGNVISDSYLSGEVSMDNMIPLSDGFELADKKYVNGRWVGTEPAPLDGQEGEQDETDN